MSAVPPATPQSGFIFWAAQDALLSAPLSSAGGCRSVTSATGQPRASASARGPRRPEFELALPPLSARSAEPPSGLGAVSVAPVSESFAKQHFAMATPMDAGPPVENYVSNLGSFLDSRASEGPSRAWVTSSQKSREACYSSSASSAPSRSGARSFCGPSAPQPPDPQLSYAPMAPQATQLPHLPPQNPAFSTDSFMDYIAAAQDRGSLVRGDADEAIASKRERDVELARRRRETTKIASEAHRHSVRSRRHRQHVSQTQASDLDEDTQQSDHELVLARWAAQELLRGMAVEAAPETSVTTSRPAAHISGVRTHAKDKERTLWEHSKGEAQVAEPGVAIEPSMAKGIPLALPTEAAGRRKCLLDHLHLKNSRQSRMHNLTDLCRQGRRRARRQAGAVLANAQIGRAPGKEASKGVRFDIQDGMEQAVVGAGC